MKVGTGDFGSMACQELRSHSGSMRWEGAIECWGGVTGLGGHAATAMTGKRRETALLQTLGLQSQHVLGGGSKPCCCYANCNTSFNLMILMLLPAIQRFDHVRIKRLESK